jgi:hypothetical protein
MDSPQSQPSNQMPRTTAWVVIIVILIILAVGGYFLLKQGSTNTSNANTTINTANANLNTNTLSNTNAVANGNTNTVVNSNAAQNTNGAVNGNTNTSVNTNTTVDTTGWRTYENKQYGFSVRYPESWTQSQSAVSRVDFKYEGFGFNPGVGKNAGYQINVYASLSDLSEGSKYSSLTEWITAHATGPYSYPKTNFLGLEAFEGYWPSADLTYSFYAEHNGKIYDIDLNWIFPESRPKDSTTGRPVFNGDELGFLSSFKFLD